MNAKEFLGIAAVGCRDRGSQTPRKFAEIARQPSVAQFSRTQELRGRLSEPNALCDSLANEARAHASVVVAFGPELLHSGQFLAGARSGQRENRPISTSAVSAGAVSAPEGDALRVRDEAARARVNLE